MISGSYIARCPLRIAVALLGVQDRATVSTCHRGEDAFNIVVKRLTKDELRGLYALGMAVRADRMSVFWCSEWIRNPPGNRDPMAHHRGKYDRPNAGGERRGIKP